MNANLQPPMPVIKDWLNDASSRLTDVGISSARLDSEILLSDILNKNRTYLHAHENDIINEKNLVNAKKSLTKRLKRIPIAYIVGYKEFYGRKFIVNSNTLVPRPESEDIINILKEILKPNSNGHSLDSEPIANLVDIGTGCGCLGITAKLEFPDLEVNLTDISPSALIVAKKNAIKHSVNVNIIKNDLLINFYNNSDIIIANLPYVDQIWDRSPETNFEPTIALFAKKHGLSIIEKLISQVPNSLKSGGYLIIEADPTQHKSLIKYAKKYILTKTYQHNYVIVFRLKQ